MTVDDHPVWRRVKVGGPEECWPWMGTGSRSGRYPQMILGGRNMSVRRVIYEHVFGPIPDHEHLSNSCGDTMCCNPAHLWAASELAARGN